MASHPQPNRIKFKATIDWHNFIETCKVSKKPVNFFKLRKDCYKDIEAYRKRPLLVYATKFLENTASGAPNFIEISDVDGFTDIIHSIKDRDAVDVLLHSPGGRPDATERLVILLRNHFKKVDFLIPHSAYSAATMLALSGDNIILHPSAVLGPIDPQIDGLPARMIKRGFEKIKKTISEEGPGAMLPYVPLIEKYSLDLLQLCEDSEKLSKNLVSDWLRKYMFKDDDNADKKIKEAVEYLSNYEEHLTHSRPLFLDKLSQLGLNITCADDTLQELLWEAHILINGFFNISYSVKLYENVSISWGKYFIPIVKKPHSK